MYYSNLKLAQLNKPEQKFIVNLFKTIFITVGRINFANLSRYSHYGEKTFRRQFDKFLDWMSINIVLLDYFFVKPLESDKAMLKECIIAIDCCFIGKSGKKTFGLDWFWSGCANASKKGLEISTIALVDLFYNTAFHLSTMQTPVSYTHLTLPTILLV